MLGVPGEFRRPPGGQKGPPISSATDARLITKQAPVLKVLTLVYFCRLKFFLCLTLEFWIFCKGNYSIVEILSAHWPCLFRWPNFNSFGWSKTDCSIPMHSRILIYYLYSLSYVFALSPHSKVTLVKGVCMCVCETFAVAL